MPNNLPRRAACAPRCPLWTSTIYLRAAAIGGYAPVTNDKYTPTHETDRPLTDGYGAVRSAQAKKLHERGGVMLNPAMTTTPEIPLAIFPHPVISGVVSGCINFRF